MDFEWDKEQRDFRATVRAFLDANLPPDWEQLAHGPGSEAQSTFSKQFCGALAAADAGVRLTVFLGLENLFSEDEESSAAFCNWDVEGRYGTAHHRAAHNQAARGAAESQLIED